MPLSGSTPLIPNLQGANATFDNGSSLFDTTPRGNECTQMEEERADEEEEGGQLDSTDTLNATVFETDDLVCISRCPRQEMQQHET